MIRDSEIRSNPGLTLTSPIDSSFQKTPDPVFQTPRVYSASWKIFKVDLQKKKSTGQDWNPGPFVLESNAVID